MGFSPAEVDQLSIWQLMAAADGYADAHNPEEGGLSSDERDALWETIRQESAH